MRGNLAWILAATFTLSGCATAGSGVGSHRASEPGILPPVGYGTLRQDQISMDLQNGDLMVKVTPLAESVIRVAAPDTYQRLERLVDAQGATAAASTPDGTPRLFLVSLYTRAAGVSFTPEDLQLVSGGVRYRPSAIVPITPGWGRHRLEQRETEMAIYAFSDQVDLESDDLIVAWGDRESFEWAQILPRVRAERARARARAGS